MQYSGRWASLTAAFVACAVVRAAWATSPYPAMAPSAEYLMADRTAEIALARSAAPASISGDAEVLVLGPKGYVSAAPGRNGFVCMVQRAWFSGLQDEGFWNPKLRAPICFQSAGRPLGVADLSHPHGLGDGGRLAERNPQAHTRGDDGRTGSGPRDGCDHLHDVQARLSRRRPARSLAAAPDGSTMPPSPSGRPTGARRWPVRVCSAPRRASIPGPCSTCRWPRGPTEHPTKHRRRRTACDLSAAAPRALPEQYRRERRTTRWIYSMTASSRQANWPPGAGPRSRGKAKPMPTPARRCWPRRSSYAAI